MKKALAILLVLLVAGVAFGADGNTLNLQSTMGVKVNHGFSSTDLTTFNSIFSPTTAFADPTEVVDMESSASQAVGYYAFASNARVAVTVKLTASDLVGPGSVVVPYTLTATKSAGTVGITPVVIATTGVLGSTTPSSVEGVLLNASTQNGPKYASYSLAVVFDGTANAEYGLPETNSTEGSETYYSGTVVASITGI